MKILQILLVLALSPLLLGIVNRTKAFFAGRKGAPLLQLYFDIAKLLKKGAVYSKTTTWLFTAGPVVGISAVLSALVLMPFGGNGAAVSFQGDIVVFVYLLGLARFFTVLAALDTGSSFEGMGASREVQFAVFAEPAMLLSIAALARVTGQLSLSGIYSNLQIYSWVAREPALSLVIGALFIIFMAENSRIPVDDPNTHLELTMIHEVMVLDHSGVDFAYILYSAALKFWLLGALITGLIFGLPSSAGAMGIIVYIIGMMLLAVTVGIAESVLARLRLIKVPQFLIVGLVLSVLALIFTLR